MSLLDIVAPISNEFLHIWPRSAPNTLPFSDIIREGHLVNSSWPEYRAVSDAFLEQLTMIEQLLVDEDDYVDEKKEFINQAIGSQASVVYQGTTMLRPKSEEQNRSFYVLRGQHVFFCQHIPEEWLFRETRWRDRCRVRMLAKLHSHDGDVGTYCASVLSSTCMGIRSSSVGPRNNARI